MNYDSSNDLNRTTSYLYAFDKSGKDTSVASGFFFELNTKKYIVTNRHVLRHAERLVISVNSLLQKETQGYFQNIQNYAIFHPDKIVDLCLIDFNGIELVPNELAQDDLNIQFLNESMIIRKEKLEDLNYIEDVVMFGSPSGIYQLVNNLSIARKGCTATHPYLKFSAMSDFLIDIASYPGSSGSAIYLCNEETMSSFEKTQILGIMHKSHHRDLDIHTARVTGKEYINLGHAISAHRLLDFKSVI